MSFAYDRTKKISEFRTERFLIPSVALMLFSVCLIAAGSNSSLPEAEADLRLALGLLGIDVGFIWFLFAREVGRGNRDHIKSFNDTI